ncbi:MAG TPA: methyltransferase domain-containing protein [Symbiobacteriaceae bacterium]|nr:methyltransferase domain-containing protein [Symbiobacteriaceae bacterium]
MTNYNFDRVAALYDATRGFPPGVAERICTWILSRLPKDPAITELGVGTGRIAIPFIERGVRYTGFDISEAMLSILRGKVTDMRNAQVAIADITAPLPLPEQSQDALISVHVLHLVDAIKALEQVRRVLKPHGALLWGYTKHGELAPNSLIRPKFHEIAAELGAGKPRDFTGQIAKEQLARWGAQVSRHTAVVWQESETPRQVLEPLREKAVSSVWHIPDDVLAEAIRRTEAWAKTQYGDIDRPHTYDVSFVADWYQF